MTLSRTVVRRVATAMKVPLPPEAAQAAMLHLRDAIGVGLASAGSPVGQPYVRLARGSSNCGGASVFGAVGGYAPEEAALMNGGLIHSLEYDDTHTASIVHGSSLAAAVSLAVAEATGASGPRLLNAFTFCWEFMIRIGLAAPGEFQKRGFHITSVGGSLAAALTAADLFGLSEDQSVAAIGISLSQASGVFEFLSNGSSVKSLHPGWAAHSGVYAAKLAAAGMTGPETALEGRWGLFRHFAVSDDGAARLEAQLGDLGTRWHVADAAFKFYPCCHFLHPFIEAAGTIEKKGITAGDISEIICRVAPGAAPIICEPWDTKQKPVDGHAIRWSLPVTIAARIVEGDIGLGTFEHNASSAVLDLAQRISWEPMAATRFPVRFEAEIECRTRGGEKHRVVIDDAYGNQSRPAKAEELEKKFRMNAARGLSEQGVTSLLSAIAAIPKVSDLKALTSALQCLRTPN